MYEILNDPQQSGSTRVAAWVALRDTGFDRPAQRIAFKDYTNDPASRESVGADGQVRVVPRQRLTRSRPQRDPLKAYKAQVCDLVLKYLYDPAALIDGLCELDPKLAELVDAIDQARDEQVNGADDFEIAEPQGPAY